jgi:predicted site-specific integrase-resolvase
MASISRSTLLRWLKDGYLQVSEYRDRRSWRLFTKDDVEKFISEANRIYQVGEENN